MTISLPKAAAALAALALGASPAAAEPLQRLENGLPVAEVRLEGRGPYRFVIDTAATRTSLLPGYWAAAGGRPAAVGAQTIHGAGGPTQIDLIPVSTLTTGGREAQNLQAYALPASAVDKLGVQGVLGADVLSQHVFVLDAPRLDWRLEDKMAGDDLQLSSAAFTLDDAMTPQLSVLVDGKAIPAIIDTGAARSIMNWAAGRALGVDPADPNLQPGGTARGVGGELAVVRRRFESLAITGEAQREVELRIADLPVFAALGLGDGPAIIVGMDLLADRRLVIDYPNRRLYLSGPAL